MSANGNGARARQPGPGERALIAESEWYRVLETSEPVHQWGSALLVEHVGGTLLLYVRDTSGAERHACVHLDAAATARARAGVAQIEALSAAAADLVTRQMEEGATSAQIQAQQDASAAFVQLAEELYRELLSA